MAQIALAVKGTMTPKSCRMEGPVISSFRCYTNAAAGLYACVKGGVSAVLHSSSAGLGCERFSHVHVSCRSEMFLYLVRGIFCGRVQRMKSCDGGLTQFIENDQARSVGVRGKKLSRFLATRPGAINRAHRVDVAGTLIVRRC
jgi:hypothetical protein